MQQIGFFFFRGIVFLVGLTPFWVLYRISDILFLIIYYIIGYRKKIVFDNIKIAFPEKSEEEIHYISKKFFHQMTDLIVEALKGPALSSKQLKKRYKIINPGVMNSFFEKGRSIMGVTGHYANWEWSGLAMPLQQKHIPVGMYKPLSNKSIDKFLRNTRTKRGSEARSIYKTKAAFEENYGRPALFGMVADQSPTNVKRAYCMEFFGRKTPFLHGPELYSKLYDLPVIYLYNKRVKRGYYEVSCHLLETEPQKTEDGEITKKYKDFLEYVIRTDPSQWLWSHKRWKRECYKKPETKPS